MDMSYWQAIVLGIIQGLTEFLPVSSSGHLVMLEHLFGLNPETDAMKLFDLAVHLGTVIAIIFFYWKVLIRFFGHFFKSLSGIGKPKELFHKSASIRFSVLAMTSIFVTGVFYVLFKDIVDKGFEEPWVVAICWLITAAVLLTTDRKRKSRRGLRQFTILAAVIIGLAQGCALFPGISRSGSTICAAVLLGLHRRWAGEFSFLIGAPTIIGAALLKGMEFFHESHESLQWGPTLVGSLASCIVGVGALAILIWALQKSRLKYFAFYCFSLSIITFLVLLFH